jgi:hypothetical protein
MIPKKQGKPLAWEALQDHMCAFRNICQTNVGRFLVDHVPSNGSLGHDEVAKAAQYKGEGTNAKKKWGIAVHRKLPAQQLRHSQRV